MTEPVPAFERLALGTLAWWEMPVAVLIMLIAVYGIVRLAARIYARRWCAAERA